MAKKREEVDREYRWNIEEIYDEGEIEEQIEQVKDLLERLEGYRGKLGEEKNMEKFLNAYSDCRRKLSKLYSYSSMKSDENMRNQDSQALKSRIKALRSEMSERTSFARIEIQQIGEEKLEKMIENNESIAKRDYYLREIVRQKPHTRSLEVEETISSLSDILDAPSETYSMLSNADIRFPKVERDGEEVRITQSNFTKLLKDGDKGFRREVYQKYYETLENYDNTIGTTFSKEIRSNVKLAELKNYKSAREAALKPDNIPVDVYDQLLEAVRDSIDVLHEHIELKAETRNLDQMGMEDVYIPIPRTEGPDVGYEEAKDYILEALEPLGEEYVNRVRQGLNNRWVDVYETEGKRSGAYSGGSYDTQPFILMNYQNDISSMFTLAHELGHSMHSQLTSENQPYLHSDYRIFIAEVASTVNEALLTDYLLENVEDQNFRKHVLDHSLENFRSTLFRQTMFAEFEKKVHERAEAGEALTAETVSKIYADLKSEFYRPVKIDEHIRNEWMRIPHFYYNFYVFQYATGISAAQKIKEQVKNSGPESYLEFLKSGGSAPPLELLRETGVDMEERKPFEVAINSYRQRIKQMRKETVKN